MQLKYIYKAFVTRVVDADTLDVTIDLGFGVQFKERIRVRNYDAPETWRPKSVEEKIHGLEATQEAQRVLFNRWVLLATYKDKKGKYGRYIADIKFIDKDGVGIGDYATTMKTNGFAKKDSYEPDE